MGMLQCCSGAALPPQASTMSALWLACSAWATAVVACG